MENKTRKGPLVSLECFGCEFYEQEYFHVQGDSGYDYFCTRTGKRVFTGSYINKVPKDCPFRPEIKYKELMEKNDY
jgi:hypothetical protein